MILSRLKQRGEFIAGAGFAGAFLAFLFFYATAPIADLDFWWHLKSGEIMVENGGLLQLDPFTFTDDGVVSSRETLILKGYWLWQIVAYGLYSALGFNGIFLLNFLTVGAMVAVVIQEMRRQQVEYPLAILLITLGFYLFRYNFFLERPQVVSFLFMAILLALLARVRDGGRLGWSLPLLMLVWPSLHGGFVVGDIVLLCFAIGAMLEYRHDLPRLRPLLFWVAAGVAASLLNPNGVLVFVELFSFHNSQLMTWVAEYQSSWKIFQQGSRSVVVLWLLIALYGLGVWLSRRLYWPELIVGLFLAYFSCKYIRNIGFFAVAMLPPIGFYLQSGLDRRGWRLPLVGKYLVVLIATAGLIWQANDDLQKQKNGASISGVFPEESSRFILSSGLSGRMFNGYNFGGYQIWRLYPQHQVFIDGRGLDADVVLDWRLITGASLKEREGRKEYEVLLDYYGIDYVVQSHLHPDNGRLTPLLKFLLNKPEWIPVYADYQSYILVRNSGKNASVIERYRMDKRDFSHKVVGYLTAYCKSYPTEIVYHVALAEMLIYVGRYDEAAHRLAIIANLQPENTSLPSLYNQLDVLKKGKKP